MKKLNGFTLFDLFAKLKESPSLNNNDLKNIVLKVFKKGLEALINMEDAKIIHRDLHVYNIFIDLTSNPNY